MDGFKVKISPPRLNGKKKSVFATRSPHRYNNIGLSLSKIDKIVESTIYLSEVDLIDGTPIIDIKPYIHKYDSRNNSKVPEWVTTESEINLVEFTQESLESLKESVKYQEYYTTYNELKEAIEQVLKLDPRGISKKLHNDSWYAFYMDNLNIIVNIEGNRALVEKVEVITEWDEIIKSQNDKVLEMKNRNK